MEHHDPDARGGDILLKLGVLVDGDQRVEAFFAHTGEQVAALTALPAAVGKLRDVEAGELALEWTRCRFVEEATHLARCDPLSQQCRPELERGDRLFARDGRKVFEKNIERVAVFEIVETRPRGYARMVSPLAGVVPAWRCAKRPSSEARATGPSRAATRARSRHSYPSLGRAEAPYLR